MKILKLDISGYKNLNVVLNLSNSTNYINFIGINGSGKSNILEAISLIFANLRKPRLFHINFSYEIIYEIKQYEVKINNRIVTLVKDSGNIRNEILRSGISNYLPSEIIACYSGDELRLWNDIYSKFYFSYINKIKTGVIQEKHNLVYINKYTWEIALVTLLCHDNSKDYIKNLLNISNSSDVEIKFSFPANYIAREANYIRITEAGTEAQNDALSLIRMIKGNQGDTSLTSNSIQEIIFINNPDNTKKARKLFYLLHAIGSDKDKKLFEKINLSFNGITLRELSEGEKKLILIKCITDVLANENSLVLYDEPDSHIHVSKKKEIISIVDKPNYFTLFTTHSPTLFKYCDRRNIIPLDNGRLYPIVDEIHTARLLVDDYDVFRLLFTTKHLVITEGKTDVQYISKAISLFADDYPQLIDLEFLVLGGTDGEVAKELLSKIRNIEGRKVILLVDRDKSGQDCLKTVLGDISITFQAFDYRVHPSAINQYTLMLPIVLGTVGEFVVEDYFKNDKIKDLTKRDIENKFQNNSKFKDFPTVKDNLKKKILPDFCKNEATDVDMDDFKVLLDKIQEIILL